MIAGGVGGHSKKLAKMDSGHSGGHSKKSGKMDCERSGGAHQKTLQKNAGKWTAGRVGGYSRKLRENGLRAEWGDTLEMFKINWSINPPYTTHPFCVLSCHTNSPCE